MARAFVLPAGGAGAEWRSPPNSSTSASIGVTAALRNFVAERGPKNESDLSAAESQRVGTPHCLLRRAAPPRLVPQEALGIRPRLGRCAASFASCLRRKNCPQPPVSESISGAISHLSEERGGKTA